MIAELPRLYSGQIARVLHRAFELGPLSRTVRRFFSDSRDATDEIKMSALAATARLLSEEGLLEFPVEHALAGAVFARAAHEWDALSAWLASGPTGYYEPRALLTAISRLWCADLALRSAALICVRGGLLPTGSPAWSSPKSFSFTLRRALQQRGMTRHAFWEAMDINKAQADEWLDGVQLPSRCSIKAMAKVLECDEVELRRVAGCSRLAQQLAVAVDTEDLGKTFRQYEAAYWRELTLTDRHEQIEVIGDAFNSRRGRYFASLALATEERSEWRTALAAVAYDWSTYLGEEGMVRSAVEAEGLGLFRAGRTEDGLRVLRNAVEREPLDAELRTLLASWLNHFGRSDLALGEAEIAACADPANVSAMVELSVIQHGLGRTLEAATRLEASAAKLCAPSVRVLHQLAQLRLELNDLRGCRVALDELVRLQPGNVLALDQLAAVEVRLGHSKAAEKHARDAWRQGYSLTWIRLHPELGWEEWEPLVDD